MSDSKIFDIETVQQIETLSKSLGGIDECKRLGFIFEDEQGILSLSTAGLGYLIYVRAGGIIGLAEAFAAGREWPQQEVNQAATSNSSATKVA